MESVTDQQYDFVYSDWTSNSETMSDWTSDSETMSPGSDWTSDSETRSDWIHVKSAAISMVRTSPGYLEHSHIIYNLASFSRTPQPI